MFIPFNNLCKKEGCNNEAEIKELCRYHYYQKLRTSAKKKGIKFPKKVTPKFIKHLSKIGLQRNNKYKKAREEYLSTHLVCEAQLPGCTNGPLEIHHRKKREGKNLWNKEFFLAVCRNCHNIIENNPKLAFEKGWSISKFKKEETLD